MIVRWGGLDSRLWSRRQRGRYERHGRTQRRHGLHGVLHSIEAARLLRPVMLGVERVVALHERRRHGHQIGVDRRRRRLLGVIALQLLLLRVYLLHELLLLADEIVVVNWRRRCRLASMIIIYRAHWRATEACLLAFAIIIRQHSISIHICIWSAVDSYFHVLLFLLMKKILQKYTNFLLYLTFKSMKLTVLFKVVELLPRSSNLISFYFFFQLYYLCNIFI